jgi:hypothetical protein
MSQLTHTPAHAIRFRIRLWMVLATALVAAALTVFIVLASGDESSSAPSLPSNPPGEVRYDGGPEEGSRGIAAPPATRYDGGPEEGSRGPTR